MQHSNQVNKSAMERLRNLAPKQITESKTSEKLTTLQESKPVAEKGMVDALRMVTEKMSNSAVKKEQKEERKEDIKMNLKEYFKERLMEEIAESFMTDAQKGTPAGKKMQHGVITPKPEHRVITPKPEHGVITPKPEHGVITPKPEHGVINPKPVSNSEMESSTSRKKNDKKEHPKPVSNALR